MLDHIGLRTRQAAAMMSFYDKALAPLGYAKQMDFGAVAGYGTPQHPALWIGAADEATSRCILRWQQQTVPRWMLFMLPLLPPGRRITGRRGCAPTITPTITAPSSSIPTGTIWKRSAICPNKRGLHSATIQPSLAFSSFTLRVVAVRPGRATVTTAM